MKKGQLQIAENIGILVVFFILLVFGLVFYVGLQKTSVDTKKEEFSQLSTVSINQLVLNLPELLCSKGFNVYEGYCFDIEKIEVFKQYLKDNNIYRDTIYFDKFKNSKIIVKKVFLGEEEYVVYDRSLENVDSTQTQLPISLYDPVNDEYSIGVLTIEVFG